MSEIKPSEGQLTVIDAEGNERLCQILFTTESEEFGKKYVVFYPIEELEDEEEGQIQLMAASYIEKEDGTGELEEVETDAEWAFLEEAVAQFEESLEEEECPCHGHCGEHEHECEEEQGCHKKGGHHCCCHEEE